MKTSISIPFADASAASLGWRLAHSAREPLAVLTIDVGWLRADLGVLGASHQVRFDADDGSAAVELVACDVGDGGLPSRAAHRIGGLEYRFRSSVQRLSDDAFAAEVDALAARHSDDPGALVGSFPGTATAVTILAFQPVERYEHARWRTWHAYPQTYEVITTVTDVRRTATA